jgi:hypothetical protein
MTTLLFKTQQPVYLNDSLIENGDLWLPIGKLPQLIGLEVKPEGVCFDDTCVPVPEQQKEMYVQSTMFNLSAFSRLMGYPIVHNSKLDVWYFGEGGTVQRQNRSSLHAPDFTLPDLTGKQYSLSSFFGKKVLLLSWASW